MIQEQYPEGREEHRRSEAMSERDPRVRDSHEYRSAESGEPRTYDEREYRPQEYRSTEAREPRAYGREREYEPQGYAEEEYEQPRRRHAEAEYEDLSEAPPEIKTVFSTSGINIIAGLWLLLAPFALGYATVETALWNSIIVGLAVGVMAIVRVVNPEEHEGVSWVNFVLGIWLLVSPFVLGLANIEWLVWNNIIVGIVIIALAATSAMATHRYRDPTTSTRPRHRHSRHTRSRASSRF